MMSKGFRHSIFPKPDRLDRILLKWSWGFFIGLFLTAGGAVWASDGQIAVSGIGYPPVKAQNKAQALLMAKRAALVDAYRKVLSRRDSRPLEEDEQFYRGLSGFIKGLTITNEEYLNDGGVRIEATVSPKDVSLFSKEKDIKKRTSATRPGRVEGPRVITVEEWYRLIEKMVNFENINPKKGGE